MSALWRRRMGRVAHEDIKACGWWYANEIANDPETHKMTRSGAKCQCVSKQQVVRRSTTTSWNVLKCDGKTRRRQQSRKPQMIRSRHKIFVMYNVSVKLLFLCKLKQDGEHRQLALYSYAHSFEILTITSLCTVFASRYFPF